MQKSIRRADTKLAGYFALELFHSGFYEYVWKRLMVISAEDCHGIITCEIAALYEGFKMVNAGKKEKEKGRIFISKAVIILCDVKKNRDADHLQNLVYDKKMSINEEELVRELISSEEYVPIPDYAYDVHTKKGRKMGKTKETFFIDELNNLKPRQTGLFDDLVVPTVEESRKILESEGIDVDAMVDRSMDRLKDIQKAAREKV
jgi:replication-associated recombination protein RarA